LRDYREIPYKAERRYPYIPMKFAEEAYAVPTTVEESRALPYYKPEERIGQYVAPEYKPIEYPPTEYRPPEYKPPTYKPPEYKPPTYASGIYGTPYTPPPYKVPPPVPPMRGAPPIKLGKKRAEDLTDFEKKSAIAWKQGVMFRLRYYPYRHEDMINTRKPIGGVKYYEGPESAYKSVVVLFPGLVPADMTFNMGLFKTNFKTRSDKEGAGTEIDVNFIERPEQAKHEQRLSKKEREELGLPPPESKKKRIRKPVIEEAEAIVLEKQSKPEKVEVLPMPPMPPEPPVVMASDIMGQPSYNEVKNGKVKVMEENKPSPTLSILNL